MTDKEFSILIHEAMIRQARPLTQRDPRNRRHGRRAAQEALYLGLFQLKADACLCPCEDSGEHCAHCVPIERGLQISYEPTAKDFAQVRGLPSPA